MGPSEGKKEIDCYEKKRNSAHKSLCGKPNMKRPYTPHHTQKRLISSATSRTRLNRAINFCLIDIYHMYIKNVYR